VAENCLSPPFFYTRSVFVLSVNLQGYSRFLFVFPTVSPRVSVTPAVTCLPPRGDFPSPPHFSFPQLLLFVCESASLFFFPSGLFPPPPPLQKFSSQGWALDPPRGTWVVPLFSFSIAVLFCYVSLCPTPPTLSTPVFIPHLGDCVQFSRGPFRGPFARFFFFFHLLVLSFPRSCLVHFFRFPLCSGLLVFHFCRDLLPSQPL